MNTDNLIALRDFLLTTNVAFSMHHYRQEIFEDEDGMHSACETNLLHDEVKAGINECNTAGCALGWAPFVITPKLEHYEPGGDLNFLRYAQETLLDKIWLTGLNDVHSREFVSIFGAQWFAQDNTPKGAAFRIHAYLEGVLYTPWQDEYAYSTARDQWLSQQ